ncbi:unnamed protein product [Ectocarpus sp. 6 AP-2014]
MADMNDLCAAFAGGFSQEGSDCVVGICSVNGRPQQLIKVVSRIPGPNEDPETLLAGVSALCGDRPRDIVVNVFQLCGGVDGSKMYEATEL